MMRLIKSAPIDPSPIVRFSIRDHSSVEESVGAHGEVDTKGEHTVVVGSSRQRRRPLE